MVLKKCRMSFPRRRESRKYKKVLLNLFQDILKRCAKLVQHDKKNLDSRFHGNDIENSSHATTLAMT
ncbi:hypothetical protein [Rickettsia endosymbiont of Orchestes rusci]|uniref:hypothetical protein n=1 Tax=Rickettsia endosymbiont of Orchestes rusci TaxID=3066250 RepID=UPI00313A88BF